MGFPGSCSHSNSKLLTGREGRGQKEAQGIYSIRCRDAGAARQLFTVRGRCAALAQLPGEPLRRGERVAGGPVRCHQETFGGFWDGGPPCNPWTQAATSVHA